MGHYPYTVFNGITLLILLLTAMEAWWRFGRSLRSNWPIVYYMAAIAYTFVFSYSLNPYGVAAGAACAIAIRLGFQPARIRFLELIALGYIGYRCIALLLMW